ncbi:uncharacterized protein LOC134195898 [Corticium candelabrum]|uniref:uncharacterized protein LOC134195898 n=1 Tax=Corticium candelabrum TaxID=121492 RepID=UPI002E257231|nr:uncharacterized protein LOC134195898 [Corticium candelabrum]
MAGSHVSKEVQERLRERLEGCLTDTNALVKYLCKGSDAHSLLSKAAKSFASQDGALSSTHDNLKRVEGIINEMTSQMNVANRSVEKIPLVVQRIEVLERL